MSPRFSTHRHATAGNLANGVLPQLHVSSCNALLSFANILNPDQAYDPQGEMLDDTPGENVDHFVPNYRPSNVSMGMERQPPPPAQNMVDAGGGQYVGSGNHTFDSYDPILDSDPFGLSASMHFPTPYAYDPHQNR